jgi:hypothetical protein
MVKVRVSWQTKKLFYEPAEIYYLAQSGILRPGSIVFVFTTFA